MKFINRILCGLFGHKYTRKRRVTYTITELYCIRCKKEFAIHYMVGTILPLDDELRKLHSEIQEEEYKQSNQ